jgi:hypothetical protein
MYVPLRRIALTLAGLLCFTGVRLSEAQSSAVSQHLQTSSTPLQPLRAPSQNNFVGPEACAACHHEIYDSYAQTAHQRTSRPATAEAVAGSFAAGQNVFHSSNPELSFQMEATSNGLLQTAITGVPPDTETRGERMDLVIGSGRKGQTYLYWKGEELFQLPISYWTELNQWVNSPGYRDGTADFSRRVPPRCLECHSTYFRSQPPPVNHYERSHYVLGLSCERCHGPGRNHVTSRQTKQQASTNGDIVNPAKLSRDRQVDLCALCHAGLGEPLRAPAFSFSPGDRISDYLTLQSDREQTRIDVHGSQVELLGRSRCFRESKTMTCLTCHDVHKTQRDAAAFSSQCLTCHKASNCGLYPKKGELLAVNCVDCHMPKQPTDLIVSDSNGRKVKPEVRNHQIKIYEDRSQ